MFVNLIPSLTSGPVFVRNWGSEEGKFPPLRSLLPLIRSSTSALVSQERAGGAQQRGRPGVALSYLIDEWVKGHSLGT